MIIVMRKPLRQIEPSARCGCGYLVPESDGFA